MKTKLLVPLLLLMLVVSSSALLGTRLVNAEDEDRSILPSDVTLANVEAFQEQMQRDLPVGTAKQDVEAYLTHWEIPHTYIGGDPANLEYANSFHAALSDIGSRNFLRASLSIWITHDQDDKLRDIWFSVRYK